MTLLKTCDICGKTERETKFQDERISYVMENKFKQKILVCVNIDIEHIEDHAQLTNECSAYNNEVMTMLENGMDPIFAEGLASQKHLKIPVPNICASCEKQLLYLAHSYGGHGKKANIFKD